jgi:hypothetical protein
VHSRQRRNLSTRCKLGTIGWQQAWRQAQEVRQAPGGCYALSSPQPPLIHVI